MEYLAAGQVHLVQQESGGQVADQGREPGGATQQATDQGGEDDQGVDHTGYCWLSACRSASATAVREPLGRPRVAEIRWPATMSDARSMPVWIPMP